jgi:hypothetical protein
MYSGLYVMRRMKFFDATEPQHLSFQPKGLLMLMLRIPGKQISFDADAEAPGELLNLSI